MDYVLICAGAGIGAPARYLVDRFVQGRHDSRTPWGTLTVNLCGSLLLGALYGAHAGPDVWLLAGTGFCGTFTTYSTFAFECVRLGEDRAYGTAFGNLSLTLLGGLGAASLGFALAAIW